MKIVELELSPARRYIVFSDCHRGDGSAGDEFARNSIVYKFALEHYLRAGFTYVELGDAEELWENERFAAIYITHTSVYELLRAFHDADPARTRYVKIWGNHDQDWRDGTGPLKAVFPGIEVYEAAVMQPRAGVEGGAGMPGAGADGAEGGAGGGAGGAAGGGAAIGPRILLLHGHQADPVCSGWCAGISRFLVRRLWRGVQAFGIGDPTRAAENPGRCDGIDAAWAGWARGTETVKGLEGLDSRPRGERMGRGRGSGSEGEGGRTAGAAGEAAGRNRPRLNSAINRT